MTDFEATRELFERFSVDVHLDLTDDFAYLTPLEVRPDSVFFGNLAVRFCFTREGDFREITLIDLEDDRNA